MKRLSQEANARSWSLLVDLTKQRLTLVCNASDVRSTVHLEAMNNEYDAVGKVRLRSKVAARGR